MYLSYYNLRTKPFQMSTDPEFLWLGEKHREALAVLKYAILENKGVLALTGDVGTGKTTLINALLRSLKEDTVTATIYDPRLEVLDFFNTVAAAFAMGEVFESKGRFTLKFTDFLVQAHKQKKSVLLIIDEAQGINEDLLEEIRLLSNLEAGYARLLNIFFVGQNELIDILQKYENRALRQRVSIRYHIDPLTQNETASYIKYRLEVGGTKKPIFDSGAIDEIYIFSGGYPRLINIMCDHALLTGFVREVQVIKADLIRECREELLVSKKTSENDFRYPGNDYRSPHPPETMFTEQPPPDAPFYGEDYHIPESEPAADPFGSVEGFINQRDDEEVFSPGYSTSEPTRPKKPSKKRFYRSPILMGFFLIVGIVAGFIFYNNDDNYAESLVALAKKQADKYVSAITESKNHTPPVAPAPSETTDSPSRIEAGKVGDSRYFLETSPKSDLLKETLSDSEASETSSTVPSKQSSQENISGTNTPKPGEPESNGDDKTIEVNTAGASNISTKNSLETESPKETAPKKTKPVDTVGSDTRQKAPVIAPITEKTPDKVEALAEMPSKVQSTSPSTSAVSSGIGKKKPVTIASRKTTKGETQILASKPVEVHVKPKTPETITTKAVKPVEKPETGTPITKPGQAQKKTPERYHAKPDVKKKKEPESPKKPVKEKKSTVASSDSADKRTMTLAAVPVKNRPNETAALKTDQPKVRKTEAEEKTPPAKSTQVENKTESPADGNVDSAKEIIRKLKEEKKVIFYYSDLETRLRTFLTRYCQTYAQKDLDKFGTFFATNALENGIPFRSWQSQYRENFNRIDSMDYDIELERFATQEETGLVKIDGVYHVKAKLVDGKKWRKKSGEISMILETDGNSFKVKQLDY